MADKKLTTEEILALARSEGEMGSGGGASAAEASPVEEALAAAEPVEAPSKPAAAKPSSTADILAAARAQSGGDKPAAPAAKPGSTADILAAARAGGEGGGAAAPKAPAGKPSSTADILAAARAGKASASAGGAVAAKPQATTAAPKKVAAAKAAGERPSVADMIKAAREGGPVAADAPPTKPKLPSRPPVPVKKKADASTRRSFFVDALVFVTDPFMAAWAVMGTIAAIWGLATARFMMPNMIVEPPTKFKIGPASDYPPGTVSAKWKAERGIWVVNTDQYNGQGLVYALASICRSGNVFESANRLVMSPRSKDTIGPTSIHRTQQEVKPPKAADHARCEIGM